MNANNVVPFDRASRGGMARRGSPDKGAPRSKSLLEIECPECRAVLSVDSARLPLSPEIVCDGCEEAIPLLALARESGA